MYYEQTVRKVKPELIIPIHWDNFTKPLTDNLEALPKFADNTKKDLIFSFRGQKQIKLIF